MTPNPLPRLSPTLRRDSQADLDREAALLYLATGSKKATAELVHAHPTTVGKRVRRYLLALLHTLPEKERAAIDAALSAP